MTVQVRAGGAFKTITRAKVRVNGAWRNIVSAKCLIGGEWKTVGNFTSGGGTITLVLNPTTISAARRLSTVTSTNVTATPSGGQGPYTYAWTKVSGDDISATNPNTAITAFRATTMTVDETRTAVFRCTCTDSFGNTDTEDLTVSLTCLPPREDLSLIHI